MYRIFLTGSNSQEFSQKHVGWQLLPAQIFTASDIPLKHVDFSHNSMRRLAERLFDGEHIFHSVKSISHENEGAREGREGEIMNLIVTAIVIADQCKFLKRRTPYFYR